MSLAGSQRGTRRPGRLVLEALWVGKRRIAAGLRRQEVGGRFIGLSATLRNRIGAILRFDDARPALQLVKILGPAR
jgi:hypothetical protein